MIAFWHHILRSFVSCLFKNWSAHAHISTIVLIIRIICKCVLVHIYTCCLRSVRFVLIYLATCNYLLINLASSPIYLFVHLLYLLTYTFHVITLFLLIDLNVYLALSSLILFAFPFSSYIPTYVRMYMFLVPPPLPCFCYLFACFSILSTP